MNNKARKLYQQRDNALCEHVWSGVEITDPYPRRFRNCQAMVFQATYRKQQALVLRSYNTDVAVIVFARDGAPMGFDLLRYVYGYTATSSQHIAKFFREYAVQDRRTWREV